MVKCYLVLAQMDLEKAYQALRSAVAADSSLHEARLRLGRVAWRLGEAVEARSALNDVLSRETGGSTAFLAHLFLGQLEEDSGKPAEAVRSYESALALDGRSLVTAPPVPAATCPCPGRRCR